MTPTKAPSPSAWPVSEMAYLPGCPQTLRPTPSSIRLFILYSGPGHDLVVEFDRDVLALLVGVIVVPRHEIPSREPSRSIYCSLLVDGSVF